MKYIVWIKETRSSAWEPNGEGPLSLKTAERIARETKHLVHSFRILAVGMEPSPL